MWWRPLRHIRIIISHPQNIPESGAWLEIAHGMHSANQNSVLRVMDQSAPGKLPSSTSIITEHKSRLFVSCISHSLLSWISSEGDNSKANKTLLMYFSHIYEQHKSWSSQLFDKKYKRGKFCQNTKWIELWVGSDKVIRVPGARVTSFAFSEQSFSFVQALSRPFADWNWNSISQQSFQ